MDATNPDAASGPVSRLRWYPERGFELDLNAVIGEVEIILVAVPLPADGTVELRAGELELDKLEILFKAQVDVGGAPGQLTEANVTLSRKGATEVMTLKAVVEDAETGEVHDVSVEVPVHVPEVAPDAGGPRPSPADEAELDWDDDDTHEAFFKDPLTQEDPLPVASRSREADDEDPDEAPPSSAERGFDRLLRALLSEDSKLDEDPPEPASQRVTSGGTVLSLVGEEDEDEAGGQAPQAVHDPADALGLLTYLLEREALELEDGHTVDELLPGVAPLLATERPSGARAADISEWLFSQDAVAELYIGDDDLAALIDRW